MLLSYSKYVWGRRSLSSSTSCNAWWNPFSKKKEVKRLEAEEEKALVDVEPIDEEKQAEYEEWVDSKRNKSGLIPYHHAVLHGLPPPEPYVETSYMQRLDYRRQEWARAGAASGHNPAIAWPSKEEIENVKTIDKLLYPRSLQEMIEYDKQKKQEDKDFQENR